MKPTIIIRTFQLPQDYASVFALWQNAGSGIHVARSDELNEIKKKLQRDPELFLVAESNGVIVGSVLGGFDGRRGIMYHLAVASRFRQLGAASALVAELEKRLVEKGCIRMYLLVYPENVQAIEFYEKRDYHKMDIAVYGKDLP